MKILALTFALAATGLAVAANAPPAAPKKFIDKIPADVEIKSDLEYVPGGGTLQSLDLYLPPANGAALPLVVFIHGGGWESCTKNDWHPSFHDLLTHGFAVASINYRLAPKSPFPAQIEDCKAAVRWLRAHAIDYHFDHDHIGVWGHSAGGHLVALMGVSNNVPALEGTEGGTGVSSSVQAVCDWSGPTDLAKAYTEIPPANPVLLQALVNLMGGADKTTPKHLAQASPITYVSATSVPFLIMQGDKDKVVSVEQARILDAALKKAGVESTLIILPGVGHGYDTPDDLAHVTAFFEKHLKSANPAPSAH